MVVINQIVDYILGDTIDKLVVNFGGLLAICIGLILTQLFYNLLEDYHTISIKIFKNVKIF